MKSAEMSFPGGSNYSATLFANLLENSADIQAVSTSSGSGGRGFPHPVIDVRFEVFHKELPELVQSLTGPYEIVGIWEDSESPLSLEVKKTVDGCYDKNRQKVVVRDKIDFGNDGVGRHRLTLAIIYKGEKSEEILGFVELGVMGDRVL